MLSIKGNHIAVGNTRIAGEEKEVTSSLELHLIRLKGQALQLIQRCSIQCTRLFILSSFDRYVSKQLSVINPSRYARRQTFFTANAILR